MTNQIHPFVIEGELTAEWRNGVWIVQKNDWYFFTLPGEMDYRLVDCVLKLNRSPKMSLHDLREQANLTQESLCKKLKIDKSTLVRWERGVHEPASSDIVSLARMLGVDPRIVVESIEISRKTSSRPRRRGRPPLDRKHSD